MEKAKIREIPRNCSSGYVALVVLLGLLLLGIWFVYTAVTNESMTRMPQGLA